MRNTTGDRAVSVATAIALLVGAVGVGAAAGTLAPAAPAATAAGPTTYAVDDARDLVDASPGDGACRTAADTCTLRAAVMESEATPPVPDTPWDWTVVDLSGLVGPWPEDVDGPCPVVLGAECFATDWPQPIQLSLGGPGDDDPASGDLDIRTPTVIQGGVKTLFVPVYQEVSSRIVGTATDRIFDVDLDPAYLQGTYNWTVAPAFQVSQLRIEHAAACADGTSTAGDCQDPDGYDGSGYRLRGTWAQLVDVEGVDVGAGMPAPIVGDGGFISHERPDGFPADVHTLDLWNDVNVGNAVADRGAAVATDDARIQGINEIGTSSWADLGGLLYVAPGGRVDPLQVGDLNGGHARLGGAVYADSGSSVHLRTIANARASVDGGGIYLESVSDEYGPASAWLVGITSSVARGNGGGAYVAFLASLRLSAEARDASGFPFTIPAFLWSNAAGIPASTPGLGGGIYNRGTVVMDGGSIESNLALAGGSGGGVFNTAPGRVTLTNVVMLGNSANVGAHLDNEGGGVADLRFVSTSNAFTDDPYGPAYGIAASSPVTVVAGLLADQTVPGDLFKGAEACTGTVHVEVGAVVPGATGNGSCVMDGVTPIDADPALQVPYGRDDLAPLDTGSGTKITGSDVQTSGYTPGPESPAVDAIPFAVCATWTAVDSRGFARPGVSLDAPCDYGAIERNARLEPLTLSLSADRATSSIGVTDVALGTVDPALLDTSPASPTADATSTAAATTLGAVSIEGSAVAGQPSALASIPVRSIDVDATPVRSIPLTAVPLSSVPVRSIDLPNGWLDVVAGTPLADRPLQTLSLADVLDATDPAIVARVDQLSLAEVDLSSTPVRSIPLAAVALAGLPVRSIPLPGFTSGTDENAAAWCAIVLAAGATCGTEPGADIDPARDSMVALGLAGVPVRSIPVRSIPVRSIPVRSIPVRSIPVRSIDLGATPIGAVPVRSIDLLSAPVRSIPFASIPVRSIPVRSIPVRSIDLATAPVRSIPVRSILFQMRPVRTIPVDGIRLATVDGACDGTLLDLAALADWNDGAACETLTLADVPDWAMLESATLGSFPALWDVLQLSDLPSDVTLADLIDASGQLPLDVTLADLGAYGDLQLADLLDAIAADADLGSIGDLLRALLPRADYPWGEIDLDTAPLATQPGANPNQPITYTMQFGGSSSGAVPSLGAVTAAATLPPGSTYVAGSSRLNGAAVADPALTRTADGGTRLVWPVGAIGTATTLTFRAHPSLDLAGGSVTAEARATVGAAATPIVRTATETVVIGPSFEPNDSVAQATTIEPARLYVSQIQAPGDVDTFRIVVPAGARLSVSLSNLPADYDLALYAPVGGGTLRQATSRSIVPGVDPELDGLGTPVVDQSPVAQDATLAVGRPLYATSTRRDTADEVIDTPSLTAGTYVIQVTGYNGASSSSPYTLRTQLVSPPSSRPACVARGVDWSGAAPTAAVPVGVETLVLVAPTRTAGLRGAADAATLTAAVDTFAATVNDTTDAVDHGTTVGVLRVDDDPAVRAAYDAWDTSSGRCDPERANDVVRAIGALIDAAGPTVRNIVIAGGDAVIPFARIDDGTSLANEREYAAEMTGNNELIAALEAGMYLSDNPYGDATPIGVGTRELYVPDLAVGRLVESADDIAAALQQFVTSGGVLDPTTATSVSTGYEFLSDGAQAVRDELTANGVQPSGLDLISDAWTSDDLRAVFGAAPGSLLASINAHFDHSRALSAAENAGGSQGDLFTTDDASIGGATPGARAGSILFSMGCHAGLSVDDATFADDTTPTESLLDWAERFAGSGAAVWAANTGYGYGDTDVVAVSEALMASFADAIDGTSTIGAAMVRAKQRYVADLGVVSPYDEKVVGEVAFYGLPMYRVAGVSPGSDAEPVTPTVDPVTGLAAVQVDVTPAFTEHTADSGRGRYWSADDGTQVTNQRPIQPKVTVDVTPVAGSTVVAAGAVIESATSVDVAGVDPVLARPTVDLGGDEPEPFVVGSAFPTALQSVNPWTDADGTARQQLVLVPGQFLATSATNGIQRRFEQLSTRVYYRDPSVSGDVDPPSITRVGGSVVGSVGRFDVEATDPSGIARVVVLWTDADQPGTWTSVDLVPDPAHPGSFTGGPTVGAGTTRLDYIVQVVDGAGNVGISSNKAVLHEATVPPVVETRTAAPADGQDGWYTSPVQLDVVAAPGGDRGTPITTLVATATLDGTVVETVTADEPGSDGTLHAVLQPGDGETVVTATVTDRSGRRVTTSTTIRVDRTRPAAGCGVPSAWVRGPIEVSCVVQDAASGIAPDGAHTRTITATADIADGTASASVPLSLPDDAAADVAGNPVLVDATVRLDERAPTVSSALDGATLDLGAAVPDEAFTCTDPHSGVAVCRLSSGDLDTSAPGEHSFTVEATDLVGNTATATFTYTVRSGAAAPSLVVDAPVPDGAAGWFVTAPVAVTATASAAPANPPADSIDVHSSGPGGASDATITNAAGGDPFAVTRTVTAEGTTTLTFTATGSGRSSDPVSTTVRLDTVDPTATCAAPTLPASAGGWYADAPIVTCTVADATSGPAVAAPTFTTTVPAGTVNGAVAVPWTVTDVAGNTASGSVVVRVDRQAPTITVAAPLDAATGSYVVGQSATVTCADGAGSGVASCSASGLDVSSPGTRSLTVTAADRAGNTTTRVISYVVRAAVGPAVSLTASPATPDGANGWYRAAVTVTASASPGDFALAGPPSLTVGGAPASSPAVVSAQGTTTAVAAVADVVGGTTTASATIRRDSVAPTIAGVSPAPGTTLAVGQAVTLTFTAVDATSGVASCTPASGTAIPTAAPGPVTITITCTDVAGNAATTTATYTVAAPAAGWSSPAGTSFTVVDDTSVRFAAASNAQLYRNFLWRTTSIPAGTAATASGTVRLSSTGSSSARGSGVAVGAVLSSTGAMVGGYTVQFDPAYSCLLNGGGGLLGAFVIQRWTSTGQPAAGDPLACVPAPTDLYWSPIIAALDRNARFWALPLTYSVTTSRVSSTKTSIRLTVTWTADGRSQSLTTTAQVATSTLGTRWGVRSWGDVAGTFTSATFRT